MPLAPLPSLALQVAVATLLLSCGSPKQGVKITKSPVGGNVEVEQTLYNRQDYDVNLDVPIHVARSMGLNSAQPATPSLLDKAKSALDSCTDCREDEKASLERKLEQCRADLSECLLVPKEEK